jgi:hypothetical protein
MTQRIEPPENGVEERGAPLRRISIPVIVSMALSLTFIVLALYIAFLAFRMPGSKGNDLLYYAALVGAYGIWRMFKSLKRAPEKEL